jgi:hypothetical protein
MSAQDHNRKGGGARRMAETGAGSTRVVVNLAVASDA